MQLFYEFYVEVGRSRRSQSVDVLAWTKMSANEWVGLRQEVRESLLQEIYDEVVGDLMVSGWRQSDD